MIGCSALLLCTGIDKSSCGQHGGPVVSTVRLRPHLHSGIHLDPLFGIFFLSAAFIFHSFFRQNYGHCDGKEWNPLVYGFRSANGRRVPFRTSAPRTEQRNERTTQCGLGLTLQRWGPVFESDHGQHLHAVLYVLPVFVWFSPTLLDFT